LGGEGEKKGFWPYPFCHQRERNGVSTVISSQHLPRKKKAPKKIGYPQKGEKKGSIEKKDKEAMHRVSSLGLKSKGKKELSEGKKKEKKREREASPCGRGFAPSTKKKKKKKRRGRR